MSLNIIITGASSGLGATLARKFATHNTILGLLGRNEERLHRVADECRKSGAKVTSATMDVRDNFRLIAWLQDFDLQHPVDIVIANAGITYAVNPDNPVEPRTAIRDIFDTNFTGVINTVNTILEGMRSRGKGQAVIISSLSAFHGIPLFPAYSASKAAVKTYYEAIRGPMAREGITITIACPGFIQTPMTRNLKGNSQMNLEYAATVIKKGIEKQKPVIIIPVIHYWGLTLMGLLPERISDLLAMKIFQR